MSDLTREERESLELATRDWEDRGGRLPDAYFAAIEQIKQAAYERGAAEVRARVEAVLARPEFIASGYASAARIRAALDADPSPSADDEGVAR